MKAEYAQQDWRADPRFSKGCGCVDHTVPCWLWLDRMDRERVREALGWMQAALSSYTADPSWTKHDALLTSIAAVGALDQPRVKNKLAMMRRLNIESIPPDLVAQVEAEWAAPRASAIKPPPRPAPPPPLAPEELRERTRATALAIELATSSAEKKRLQAELQALTLMASVGRE
jgi:hypothetical protein